jgi:hypothetical protein
MSFPKRNLFVLTLALAMMSSFAFASDADKLETDDFVVELPAGYSKPAKQEQTIPSESGPIRQVTYVAKNDTGSAVVVTYSIMTGKILDPAAMMKSGRDSLIKSLNAKVDSEQATQIAGRPSLRLSYSAAEPRPIFARTDFVVHDDKMYQIIFLGASQEERQNAAIARIFDSFKVK